MFMWMTDFENSYVISSLVKKFRMIVYRSVFPAGQRRINLVRDISSIMYGNFSQVDIWQKSNRSSVLDFINMMQCPSGTVLLI